MTSHRMDDTSNDHRQQNHLATYLRAEARRMEDKAGKRFNELDDLPTRLRNWARQVEGLPPLRPQFPVAVSTAQEVQHQTRVQGEPSVALMHDYLLTKLVQKLLPTHTGTVEHGARLLLDQSVRRQKDRNRYAKKHGRDDS